MKTVQVNTEKGYPIYIENNILGSAGELLRRHGSAEKICLVSDSNVYPLYGAALRRALEDADYAVCVFVLPAGETSKTPATVMKLVQFLADEGLTRSDMIAALGGGVVGDIAGFAAAIYLRGIDFVQLPTTLLAQADASVGGKTAVDLPQGKNLCGAFHQPKAVLTDPVVLQTLSPRCFADGMAEVIKTACIKDAALFATVEREDAAACIEDVIVACVTVKAAIVARDETEHGERALLNFGHTAGHAIERLHGYEGVTHGEAVAMGMALITDASERNGLTAQDTAERLAALLAKYHLKTADTHPTAAIVDAMRADKKRTGEGICFAMLKAIGEGMLYPLKYEEIPPFFGI